MPFNLQTFQTRTLTAILFAIIMLSGLLWNRWSFFILFSIVHFGAWIEYRKLITRIYPEYTNISVFHSYGVMIAGWCMMFFFTNDEIFIYNIHFQAVSIWIGLIFIFLIPLSDLIKGSFRIPGIAYSVTGLIYISLPLALFTDLRNHWIENNFQLSLTIPLLIIFSLWINDTMAYIMGSFIGKTPLSSISPKKTWEGTISGIILTILLISIMAIITHRMDVTNAAIMSGLAAISGTIGDLAESKLKRMAKVKDSGKILPGHGGFLDRFDSLLFASVVIWFYAIVVFGL